VRDGTHGSFKDVELGIPLLSAKDISDGKINITDDARLISIEDYNSIHKKYELNNGDILLTIVGTIGRTAMVNISQKFTLQRSVAILRVNEEILNDFLYYYIQTSIFQNRLKSVVNQSAQGGVYLNSLKKLNIKLTSDLTEQSKISAFLSVLDEKIELLNKKYQYYVDFKKYLMQQIFAQKLRFNNEDWDSKKLGKLCKITMGQSPSSKNYSENPNDTVLIQGNADIFNGKIVPRVYTSQITKTSKPGDIILTVRAPVGDLAINEFDSCIGRGVCSIEGDKFIYYSLQSLKEKHIWERFSQGSTFESINSNDIKNLKINIPSQFEQKKIVDVLSNVDDKIELMHKNINDIKKFKNGLLQQMFVYIPIFMHTILNFCAKICCIK